MLWNWKFADKRDRDEITCSTSNLLTFIEFYLPFDQIGYTRKLGIWCDGILQLSIDQLDRCGFLIAGVGYFPNQLAPFELEFHFANRRDLAPQRIILRFAELGHKDEIRWHENEKNAEIIFSQRPSLSKDWAVAVELTPIETRP